VRLFRGLVLGATLAIALSACSDGNKPEAKAEKKKPQVAKNAKPKADKPPAFDPDFRYNPSGKRDPFRSYIAQMKQAKVGAATTPLERFDVSQLRVTAVIWGTERPRAIVKDPTGKGYIVAEGTPIGKNQGRVIEIADSGVTVKETYVDFLGNATSKDIELRLQGRKKGG
jgi:type IV pilus assembly protein PilP